MSNDSAETSCNTDVAATTDKQTVERKGNGIVPRDVVYES